MLQCYWPSLVAQQWKKKNQPAIQETWVQSLSPEDLLEEGVATHPGILAWEIPWTEGYLPQSCKELDMTETTQHAHIRGATNNFKAPIAMPCTFP